MKVFKKLKKLDGLVLGVSIFGSRFKVPILVLN
jgi:hypothetical protein